MVARPYSLGLGWCGVVLGGANLTVAPVVKFVHTYTAFEGAKVKHFFARIFAWLQVELPTCSR